MSVKTSKRKRWAIQVVYANGQVAYLRRGPNIGLGPVAAFTSKLTARINADNLRDGLDAADCIRVVPWASFKEKT